MSPCLEIAHLRREVALPNQKYVQIKKHCEKIYFGQRTKYFGKMYGKKLSFTRKLPKKLVMTGLTWEHHDCFVICIAVPAF